MERYSTWRVSLIVTSPLPFSPDRGCLFWSLPDQKGDWSPFSRRVGVFVRFIGSHWMASVSTTSTFLHLRLPFSGLIPVPPVVFCRRGRRSMSPPTFRDARRSCPFPHSALAFSLLKEVYTFLGVWFSSFLCLFPAVSLPDLFSS